MFLVALVSPLEKIFKLACTGTVPVFCVLSKVFDDMSYNVEQVFTVHS